MIWSCEPCGTVLKLWQIKCPNCRKSAVSWLQLAAAAAIALPVLYYVSTMI
jgi:hypothetical protein